MHGRAPVYRNVEARTSLAGLAFPSEVLAVLTVLWLTMLTLPLSLAMLSTAALYGGIRLVNYGRPDAFLQHWLTWQVRRLVSRGRFSAAARARIPRCPYGPYDDGRRR